MKILFDLLCAQPIGNSKFHGGGEYIKSVFQYLAENCTNKAEIVVFYDYDRFIDDWIKEQIEFYKIRTYEVKKVQDVPILLGAESFDVFYSGLAYSYDSVHFPDNVRKIGTIHGLRTLEMPCDKYTSIYNDQGLIRYLKDGLKWKIVQKPDSPFEKKEKEKFERIINNFDSIVTVSNHTKYAIQSWLPGVKSEKIHVFYTPAKYVAKQRKDFAVNDKGKYILMLGGNRWIKNSTRCILALEQLFDAEKLRDYSVVLCGKIPKKVETIIHHKEKYHLLDYVKPEDLENLYENCDFFLYLSLNEGFGMPPLEAMQYGKTVITSPICSIPEVCGEAVYYANPYDLKEIQNRILWASETKKPEEKVVEHFNVVKNKQLLDLKGLCDFILGDNQ
ncbi:glycosyltransferase [Beduinella massiliensis]|uniref:glycosyltransferase n=1 Tax=Beduinella massiliensis TaxID=1852363 RepID=UPI000C828B26